MNCRGLHCPGCGHHGGRAGAIFGLVVLALIVANARAVGRIVADVLGIVAIVALSAAGVALAGGTTAAVVMLRRHHAARQVGRRADAPAIVRVLGPGQLPGARDAAELPPAVRLHAVRDEAGRRVR